ncbi:MAG: histidine kinase [Chloroflexota bacterium]|nr:MAG: ATPase [Chloroflexota bacterium]
MNRLSESRLFQRFWDIAGAASIRIKVLGIVLGVIFLLGFFITLQLRGALWSTLEHELVHQGDAIALTVAQQTALMARSDNRELMAHLIEEYRLHYSDANHNTIVDYIVIVDNAGNTVVETYAPYVDAQALAESPYHASPGQVIQLTFPWGGVLEHATPLNNELVLRLGLSEQNILNTVNTVTIQIVSITLVMVGIGLVAAFFLTWILTKPILSLVDATKAVAAGDFSQRVPRWANDEIGELASAFNVMTSALEQADRERGEREALREKYIRGVIQAQEEERKRIARELHDSTSQSLTSLLVGLTALENSSESPAQTAQIKDIRQVVSATLEEVHSLAWQLRPSVLDDHGLLEALHRYISDYQRRHNIQVDFVEHGLDERLPLALETGIYRMVQEGLTNIARHAKAQNASVLIERRNGKLRVIIEDDGRGFDPSVVPTGEHNLGLQGIRERAQLFGGKLTIESAPGQGASLFIEIPLEADMEPMQLEQGL